MSITQQEEKYINHALADLLERAVTYISLSREQTRSTRDKAIWRAMALELARAYNHTLSTLGLVGTSKLAKEQRLLIDKLMQSNGFRVFNDQDMQNVIQEVYGLDLLQREHHRQNLNKQKAQAFLVSCNSNLEVQEAIKTLIKHGAVNQLIPLENLIAHGISPELPNLARGNARKGGLVSSYMAAGATHTEALIKAEKDMALEAFVKLTNTEDKIEETLISTKFSNAADELKAAIAKVEAESVSISEGDRLLALLEE